MRGAWKLPRELPCGCPLTNKQGHRIYTHAIKHRLGGWICKCARFWHYYDRFMEVGYKEMGV